MANTKQLLSFSVELSNGVVSTIRERENRRGAMERDEKEINEIRKVVLECESRLNDILQQFSWTKDQLPKKKEKPKITEPIIEHSMEQKHERINQPLAEKIDLDALAKLCAAIDKKPNSSTGYTDINMLKRALKRRRAKHHTIKSAPLTYTEELRQLISLQMELVKGDK